MLRSSLGVHHRGFGYSNGRPSSAIEIIAIASEQGVWQVKVSYAISIITAWHGVRLLYNTLVEFLIGRDSSISPSNLCKACFLESSKSASSNSIVGFSAAKTIDLMSMRSQKLASLSFSLGRQPSSVQSYLAAEPIFQKSGDTLRWAQRPASIRLFSANHMRFRTS